MRLVRVLVLELAHICGLLVATMEILPFLTSFLLF